MIEATGAQIVVKLLENQGVSTVAGIPGGSILPLYDELARSEKIRHVLVRHEQGGGFLAQGISRSSGAVGVCLATSGPGAMNLLTAVADAQADSIPLVAITGQVNTYLIGTDAFQEVDTFGLSFPIAKHSVMVKSARELLTAIPRAFSLATSGRPGPVLVDIPRDVQLEKTSFESWPEPGERVRKASQFRTGAAESARILGEAAALLSRSKKPVLYAGGGCATAEAAAGVARLMEAFPLPAVTSLMGLGAVPASRDGNMGMVGMHGSLTANRAMHDADAVLAVGVRFDDRATGAIAKFCPNARIIHIDIDAAEVNKILPSSLSLVGDAESALPALAEALDELAMPEAERDARDRWLSSLVGMKDEEVRSRRARGAEHPGNFIASLPEIAREFGLESDDLIVTTDVGQHQMWAAQEYPVERPRQFLTSGSLGTMGFGLPTAIGAALANPTKRVVCLSGDGSIMMNVQELATLAERGLDVTVIVLENGTLGMVRQQQEIVFKERYSACFFDRSPDLLKIAEGFGLEVADASEEGWERVAFSGSGPRFIRKRIPPKENVYPFVLPGTANVDALTGR